MQRFDAGGEVLHGPRPRGLRVGDDLLAGGAVVPRVVEDAVMAREPAGEDRGVVGEGDRREPGHRTPFVGGAHVDQASDVGCLAGGRHRVQHVRVHAVEEEADEMTGPTAGGVEHVVAHDAVLSREVIAVLRRAHSPGARRASARRRPGAPHAARSRRCAPPCRRSRTAPVPATRPTNRARRGGRPGLPSCARRCAARRGRVRRDGRRAARCGRRRGGRSSRRAVGWGSASSAVRPTSLSGDWSAMGSCPSPAGAFVAVDGARPGAPEFDPALGAGGLVGVGAGAAHHHVDDR